MMKKIFAASAFLLLFAMFVPHVLAQGFVPLAPIPNLTQGVTVNSEGLAAFFNNLYKYLIGLAAALAVIEIIRGGLEISTQDSISKQSQGREHIQQAILGMVLVLSPVLVFSIINPSILNLSINLPPLDTKSGVQNNNSAPNAPAVAAPAAGCAASHSGPYLETAICANSADAQDYYNKTGACQNGLKPTIAACKVKDVSTKLCVDVGVSVYCAGKTQEFYTYHSYISGFFSNKITSPKILVPRDVTAESDFISGCTADGGKITKTELADIVTCPTDAGIPTTIAGDQSGYSCEKERLVCNP